MSNKRRIIKHISSGVYTYVGNKLKKYIKDKNKSELVISQPKREYKRKYEDPFKNFSKIHAPENLSFIKNPIDDVEFISNLEIHFNKKKKVFVVLKYLTSITYDTIVVLLSIMVKFKAHKIDFNGDYPLNANASKVLEDSQFLKYLYKQFKEEERNNLGQHSPIHTHAYKDVDSELESKLIENTSKTVVSIEYITYGNQLVIESFSPNQKYLKPER